MVFQYKRQRRQRIVLGFRYSIFLIKIVQHHISPLPAGLRMKPRIVGRSGFQHPDKRGTLLRCQFVGRCAEISLSGRPDAVCVASEIHRVEIHRQYFLFREKHFKLHGRNPFFCLHHAQPDAGYIAHQSRRIFRSSLKHVFHQLLRNRACTARIALGNHVLHGCRHTLEIDPEMLIKPLILRSHKRLDHHWRYFLIGHRDAILPIVTAHHDTIGTVNNRCRILLRMRDGFQTGRLPEKPKEINVDHQQVYQKQRDQARHDNPRLGIPSRLLVRPLVPTPESCNLMAHESQQIHQLFEQTFDKISLHRHSFFSCKYTASLA